MAERGVSADADARAHRAIMAAVEENAMSSDQLAAMICNVMQEIRAAERAAVEKFKRERGLFSCDEHGYVGVFVCPECHEEEHRATQQRIQDRVVAQAAPEIVQATLEEAAQLAADLETNAEGVEVCTFTTFLLRDKLRALAASPEKCREIAEGGGE